MSSITIESITLTSSFDSQYKNTQNNNNNELRKHNSSHKVLRSIQFVGFCSSVSVVLFLSFLFILSLRFFHLLLHITIVLFFIVVALRKMSLSVAFRFHSFWCGLSTWFLCWIDFEANWFRSQLSSAES